MKLFCFSTALFLCLTMFPQNKNYVDSIIAFQEEYTEDYTNPETSPYKKNAYLFSGHDFFPIDENYKVKATFKSIEATDVILNTSSSRLAEYTKLGVLEFQLNDETFQLAVFYSEGYAKDEEYADKAFVPFMDLTNGESTYTNGRYCYVNLPKVDGEEVIIDFNTSTNPYCAYVSGYSCTVPPEENVLAVEVLAGIKKPK